MAEDDRNLLRKIWEKNNEGVYPAVDLKTRVRRISQSTRDLVRAEQRHLKEPWVAYGSGTESYNKSFTDLLTKLGFTSFQELIASRRRNGQGDFVIDIMGDGQFLRELSPSAGGIAMTLVDRRHEEIKLSDKDQHLRLIAGDVQYSKTWGIVDKYLKEMGIVAADLIVCRGAAGVELLPPEYYYFLARNAWHRLSTKDGIIITQIPPAKFSEIIKWGQIISEEFGIRFIYQERYSSGAKEHSLPAIALVKTADSPKILPRNEYG